MLFLTSWVLGIVGGIRFYYLHQIYLGLPQVEERAHGRIYPYHTQGITVFLTKDEQRSLRWAQDAFMGGFLLAVVIVISNRGSLGSKMPPS